MYIVDLGFDDFFVAEDPVWQVDIFRAFWGFAMSSSDCWSLVTVGETAVSCNSLFASEEIEKMSVKMSEVEACDVPVVSEDFLDDAGKGAALLKIPNYTISSWGTPRHSVPTDTLDFGGGGKSFKSTGTSFVNNCVNPNKNVKILTCTCTLRTLLLRWTNFSDLQLLCMHYDSWI